MLQVDVAPLAMVAPVKFKKPAPAVPPVTAPPQLLVRLGVGATTSPLGKVSLKLTLPSAPRDVLLVSTRVMRETPFTRIELTLKDLAILGLTVAIKASVPKSPVPPLVEVMLAVWLT